jgi:hypothetical protein
MKTLLRPLVFCFALAVAGPALAICGTVGNPCSCSPSATCGSCGEIIETEAGACACDCSGCAVTSTNVNAPSNEVCTPGDQEVTVTWTNGAGTLGSRVYQPGTTFRYAGGSPYTQPGLTNGTAYTYRLRGYINCTGAAGVGYAQSSAFVECSATPVASSVRPSVGFWSMFLPKSRSPGPE